MPPRRTRRAPQVLDRRGRRRRGRRRGDRRRRRPPGRRPAAPSAAPSAVRSTGLWARVVPAARRPAADRPGLAHGAVLGSGPAGAGGRPAARGPAPWSCTSSAARTPGGRSRSARGGTSSVAAAMRRVPLDDPDVSRRHVAVDVGGGSITVADLGSTNGSRLEGRRPRRRSRGLAGRARSCAWARARVTVAGSVRQRRRRWTPGPGGRVLVRPAAPARAPGRRDRGRLPAAAGAAAPRVGWPGSRSPSLRSAACSWPGCCTRRRSCSSRCSVRSSPLGTWLSERWSGRRSGRREAAAHASARARGGGAARRRGARPTSGRPRPPIPTWRHSRPRHGAAPACSGAVRPDDADALTVRARAAVPDAPGSTRVDGDGSRGPQPAAHLPGRRRPPRDRRAGRRRPAGARARRRSSAVVAQLTALHPPGDVDLLLLDRRRSRSPDWAVGPLAAAPATRPRCTSAPTAASGQDDERTCTPG